MGQPAKQYDVGIVGAGAAGLTASIFTSRYQLSTIVFGTLWGGEIANAYLIENYPGFTSITGAELTQKMLDHAKQSGAEIRSDKIIKVTPVEGGFELIAEAGEKIPVKTVILTTGTRRRHLNVPGEDKLAGHGVSYCATCDAPFFKGKATAVVGGGDSAMTAALQLAELSPQVHLIVRRKELSGEPIWQKQIHANPKISVLHQTEVIEIIGEDKVRGIKLSRPHEGKDILEVEGVFVEVGADPDVELAKDLGVKLDEEGFIEVSEDMRTNLPGIYAAGDATTGNAHLDQIISAEAEGGLAARSAFWDLCKEKPGKSFWQKIFNI